MQKHEQFIQGLYDETLNVFQQGIEITEPRNGTVLVGNVHTNTIDLLGAQRPEFRRVLNASVYLVLEGGSRGIRKFSAQYPHSLESISYKTMLARKKSEKSEKKSKSRDNVFFLEENIGPETFLKYGTPLDLQPKILSLSSIHAHFLNNGQLSADRAHALAKFVSGSSKEFEGIDIDAYISAITNANVELWNNLIKSQAEKERWVEMLYTAGNLANYHRARIRDYELIAPEVLKLSEQLDGPQLVIIGQSHVPAVTTVLQGGILEQPPLWDELLTELPEEYAIAIREISALGTSQ